MSHSTLSADRAGTERVRYFARQLLTADDMRAEQEYFLAKLRRHNRFMHGTGVACGLEVTAAPDAATPLRVMVSCGYALGPCGDEIWLERTAYLDLATCGTSGATDPCAPLANPCGPPLPTTTPSAGPRSDVFVGIRYAECATRPVRVLPAGCGCDDASCEFSRTRDGVALRCWPVPNDWKPTTSATTCADVARQLLAACAPCPDDPWVILARVSFASTGAPSVSAVDNGVRQWLYNTAAMQAVCCATPSSPQ